jgi:hypothetical protein
MILIFLLWTFHLYVATFQQHLHMEYISLSWSDIPELVVPIMDFLDIGLLLTETLLNQGFLLVKWKSSLRKFYGRHHDLIDRYGISVSQVTKNMFQLSLTSLSFPHSWFITGCVTRLTLRVPLVERELLTLPEYPSSPPVLSGIRVTRSLVLCVCFVNRYLSFWSLRGLSFFDLWILITPLISSISF